MKGHGFVGCQILLSLAAILCALPGPAFAQSVALSDEEYRVYDAIVASKFDNGETDFGSLSDGRLLVIRDQNVRSSVHSDQWDYIGERAEPSEEALADYKGTNDKLAKLTRKFGTKAEYVLLSQKAWDRIFKPDGTFAYEGGWKAYYEKYPKSRGYIAFSRVGFNKSKSEAFLYFEHSCGSLCASGYYIILQKRADAWSVKRIVMTWIS